MLPKFPEFKKIELTDKAEVDKITSRFPPYSDFNFVSMWSWDTKEEMAISELYGNLVVRFNDYVTGKEPFYSFLGNNKVNETIKELLDFCAKEGIQPRLRMVPKDAIKNIDVFSFVVEEDTDHFDYIYSLEDLKNYQGHNYEVKRNFVRRFLRAHPEASTEVFDLNDKNMQAQVLSLYQEWADKKLSEGKEIDAEHETRALQNFFDIFNHGDFLAVGVFADKKMVGCSIIEVLKSEYIISHFFKANWDYVGVYAYLMQEGARMGFSLEGKKYFNFEQDLGITGLRKSKTLFRPKFFLKKFMIRPRPPKQAVAAQNLYNLVKSIE